MGKEIVQQDRDNLIDFADEIETVLGKPPVYKSDEAKRLSEKFIYAAFELTIALKHEAEEA